MVETKGASYFKTFLTALIFLQAFEVLKLLMPNPFEFATNVMIVDNKFLGTF